MTRPFRMMLGRFGHYPHYRHHEASTERSPGVADATADARLGRVGPPAWPNAYEAVVGFAFWPDDYASRLRGHGFDVIADTISGRFETPRAPAQVATTGSAVQSDASGTACQDTNSAQNDWPSTCRPTWPSC